MNDVPDLRPRLLLVDDEPANLQLLRQILQAGHALQFATDGEKALALAAGEQRPQLILLDVMMPGLSGLEVCRRLKADPATRDIPVIFVTALANEQDEAQGFAAGAVDYITKPVSPPIVRARVSTHLSLVRAEELRQTRLQIIQTLGRAAEYKDNETGLHVVRMSHYARLLARQAGLGDAYADKIFHAAPMHDVGKLGIPDSVLRKPGPLDDAEWAQMRRHPEIGAEILGDCDSLLMRLARSIAMAHHEKFDGSGYPKGLAGADIPLEARIVAVADVFDALTSVRPYKPAWSVERAVTLLQSEAGRHFDPALVNHFVAVLPEVLAVRERFLDEV